MKKTSFFVFDTNTLISAALISTSVNAGALDSALNNGTLAISEPTLQEFIDVISQKKFDKYFLDDGERLEIIDRLERNSVIFFPKGTITACRDPKDNKFLDLSVAASGACLITGDKDLLILHPFCSIPILSAADFLSVFSIGYIFYAAVVLAVLPLR